MLVGLSVRDIVLIEKLDLTLDAGLTALTGETGAGKSILLDALGLAAGGRAEKSLVRTGAARGVASARFHEDPAHPVWRLLAERGVGAAPAEDLILRREQRPDGRTRAFINDEPVSVGLLKAVGDALVETHGQNDGHGFLRTDAHRGLLDAFGGCGALSEQTAAAAEAVRRAETALTQQRAQEAETAQEAAYLREVVGELERLDPQPGEEAALAERRVVLMSAERISADLQEASEALAADSGVEQRLAAALRRLEDGAAKVPPDTDEGGFGARLAAAVKALDQALLEVQEARGAVERLAADLDADPAELESVETRLFALRAAARKYAAPADRLNEVRETAALRLSAVEDAEARGAALEADLEAARGAYAEASARLSEKRRAAAKKLDAAVAKQLKPLKLDKAKFRTRIDTEPERIAAAGADRVEFEISTNPGAPMGPLAQIASGGELSRFVLALKAALAAKDNKTVVIFDEVDAGVGGAVADAVGERLAHLADEGQVLVVTHSPQVAARAGTHLRISKTGGKTVRTQVSPLGRVERLEELARMLAGAEVTAEARAAAARLLEAAEGPALKRFA